MQLDDTGRVAVAEIILYTPCLFASFAVCLRQGFKRSSGWIFLLALCLVRLSGAACTLVAYSSPSTGVFEASIILDSVGISPLLLASLGGLSRLYVYILEYSLLKFNPSFTNYRC